MRRRLCMLLCLVLLMTGLPVSFTNAEGVSSAPLVQASVRDGMVRVYLSSMGNPARLDVTVAGNYTAHGAQSMALSNGEKVTVHFDQATGQITLVRGGQSYAMGQEMSFRRHAAKGSNGLRIAQTRMPENLYPGDLRLVAQKNNGAWRMYSIVNVYIEYYLYGVVPYEMGNSAPLEALKAQAVAARTYTLNKMNLRKNYLYDVVDTTNDQVYYGNSDTTANCTAAVDATRGVVVMNGSELTGTYYTASNGGQMESAANGFNASGGYGYLNVKDDPFDLMNSASVKRSVNVYADNTVAGQNENLRNLLTMKAQGMYGSGAAVTRIHGVTPHTPMYASPSRLYTKLDFDVTIDVNGAARSATLTMDIFNELEKPLGMSINSRQNELWTVEETAVGFKLVARRFGHGIGMSQRGAMQMGSMGYTYDQILGFYYEGCQRVQYAFSHTILSDGGDDTITSTEPPADITQGSGSTATVRLSGVKDRLAIRAAANEHASVLTSVVSGGLVTVLAKGDAWTLVRLGQVVGYVPTSALKFSGNPPVSSSETPTVVTRWATVQCNGTLNLRSAPSLSGGVQGAIPDGAVLCVFDTQSGWAKVQYGASVGWASMDFLVMSDVYPGQTTGQGSTAAKVNIPSGSGTVNLRETASTTSRVLTTIAHASDVTVLVNDGSWCFVRYGGHEGYIMNKFLAFDGQVAAPPAAEENKPSLGSGELEAIVKTASGTLNLRVQPSTGAPVLMTLPRGESIIVTQRGSDWCAVRYAGVSGYVMSKFLSFPGDGQAAPTGYATVATQSGPLNMRSQPTTGSAVRIQIPRGAQVAVLSQEGSWTHVRYSDVSGYVMSSFLRMDSAPAPAGKYVRVTTSGGGLNLRETASANARVLLSIPNGTVMEVLDRTSGWVKVNYNGSTGYAMEKFLTFTDDAPAKPTTPPATGGTGSATVSTGGGTLNMRQGESITAGLIGLIPDGSRVEILQNRGEWCQIQYAGITGYVKTEFLRLDKSVGDGWVNTASGGLNLREMADGNSRVLLSIPQGAQVQVLVTGNAWCKVMYADMTGYVKTEYLSFQAPAAKAWYVNTTSGGLNLREMADGNSRVLLSIPKDAQVTMLDEGGEWSRVEYAGHTGYVKTEYLREE